jgi:uncharacterized protein
MSETPPVQPSIHQQFIDALDALVVRLKQDRSILATLLCGSLSHDTVWAKSDIDLVLVTIDDRKVEEGDLTVSAEGIPVHAILVPRTAFRRMVDGSVRNSFTHSFLTKGRLLYTHDPTIADLCATLPAIGQRDQQMQLLRAATHAVSPLYKAHKWFVTRGDLDYTALWILHTATPLAQMEVIGAGLLADREVIPQALRLNPALFQTIYVDLLNRPKTRAGVRAALDAIDGYLAARAATAFGAVLAHLREVGEARSCRDIEHHFRRNFDIEGVTTACEYLADRGLIGKASVTARLTKKSNVEVEELAFFALGPE